MKNLTLFVVAAIATVSFASCGGGKTDGAADSTKKDSVAVVVTTPKDTTPTVDSVAIKAEAQRIADSIATATKATKKK